MGTRSIHRLSSLDVRRAVKRGAYCDGAGLYLQIARDGSRSWVFRFRLGAYRRHMGLGSVHSVSLAQARELAGAARRQLLAGKDPIEARRTEAAELRLAVAKTMTFREATAAYVTSKRAGWQKNHADQWTASLTTHVFPVLGNLPVQAVDTALIMRAVEPIWAVRTETASRVRSRIEAVLDWATTRGFRHGDNPARWQGHLSNLLPSRSKVAPRSHLAALPYNQIAGFMTQLRAVGTVVAKALEFTILTAARSGEVLGADWSEIDIEARIWTVPASRMKEHRQHCVPLSDAALAVLGPPGKGLVFSGPAGRQIAKNSFIELLRRMGHSVTAHGFRSTFRVWAAEQTDVAFEVAEMALSHKVGNEVSRAYFRSDLFDRRRFLMDAWASFCAGVEQADNVRPMRRA